MEIDSKIILASTWTTGSKYYALPISPRCDIMPKKGGKISRLCTFKKQWSNLLLFEAELGIALLFTNASSLVSIIHTTAFSSLNLLFFTAAF